MRVFIRQPFTESGVEQQRVVQAGMDVLSELAVELNLTLLTPLVAQHSGSFKDSFERDHGLEFTPRNFRRHRLGLVDQADAFVVLRSGLSESGAFEVAYNIFSGRRAPMFFAVWKKAPIKTTLLRELDDMCEATYCEFETAEQLRGPFVEFFARAKAYTPPPGM